MGGVPGLWLVRGLVGDMGDGVRSAPLSVKATVELIQLLGKLQVICGVGGCRSIFNFLSEPSPDRSRVISRELVL